VLARHFGSRAQRLRELAQGIDNRPVQPSRERRSVSIEDTFQHDVSTREEALRRLDSLAAGLARRMERGGYQGRTITLKVKYHDFRINTRSLTLPAPTREASVLLATAKRLLERTEVGSRPIRLLGLGVAHLDEREPSQLLLPFEAGPTPQESDDSGE
jgi:DNA polymerase-4